MGVPFLCPAAGHTFRYPVGIRLVPSGSSFFELRYFRGSPKYGALVKEFNVSSRDKETI